MKQLRNALSLPFSRLVRTFLSVFSTSFFAVLMLLRSSREATGSSSCGIGQFWRQHVCAWCIERLPVDANAAYVRPCLKGKNEIIRDGTAATSTG
jgi:hypothetical protein